MTTRGNTFSTMVKRRRFANGDFCEMKKTDTPCKRRKVGRPVCKSQAQSKNFSTKEADNINISGNGSEMEQVEK